MEGTIIAYALFLLALFSWTQSIQGVMYKSLGCFRDTATRELNGFSTISGSMTNELCIQTCIVDKGFTYAGTQNGYACHCGNSYGQYGPSSGCTYACTGDSSQICGGHWANLIHTTRPCQHADDSKEGRRWKPKKGSRLSGHVFSTVTIKSRIMCAGLCQNKDKCCSFNYRAAGGECELNDAGKAATADAGAANGWTWYHEY